jgi:hypothetical protein
MLDITKGDILQITEGDSDLEIKLGEITLVLDTPDSFPLLGNYLLQPLSLDAQRAGLVSTPAYSIPPHLFAAFIKYTKLEHISDLKWNYLQDHGKQLTKLIEKNPGLAKYTNQSIK